MKTFEFTIIARGPDPEADDFEARFYDAGCDDAGIGFQNGHILLDFARKAYSLTAAIASAIEDVCAAGAVVERIEPDPLVSLIDMADRSGMSRAAMTNYFKGHRQKGFPAPKARVTSHSPLWDWAAVAAWLYRNGRISKEEALEAGILTAANELLGRGAKVPDVLPRCAEELEATLH